MGKISASIMCVDYRNFVKDIKVLEKIGVDYIHFDVMDGHFVPNFTMGPDLLKQSAQLQKFP